MSGTSTTGSASGAGGSSTSGSGASSVSTARFSPSYLEVKGFCVFEERGTKGATRPEAKAW
eukprot:11193028-Lingulodinium_polyedra.AAC.1